MLNGWREYIGRVSQLCIQLREVESAVESSWVDTLQLGNRYLVELQRLSFPEKHATTQLLLAIVRINQHNFSCFGENSERILERQSEKPRQKLSKEAIAHGNSITMVTIWGRGYLSVPHIASKPWNPMPSKSIPTRHPGRTRGADFGKRHD